MDLILQEDLQEHRVAREKGYLPWAEEQGVQEEKLLDGNSESKRIIGKRNIS